ncbi:MAG TPA: Pycsar system effector family protein [Thermomicrobiales bacterium]
MSVSHGHDEVEQRLLSILAMVNDWLKFAETKNAGLVGLGSAGAAVAASFLSQADDRVLTVGLGIAAVLLSICVLIGLASFFPRTSLARYLTHDAGRPGAADNLYYYGHLARYAPAALVEAIARDYAQTGYTDVVHARSRDDLAAQIIVNSRITLAKLQLFGIATWFFAAAAVTALMAVLVAVVT